jgi:hypothetical protein
MKLSQWLLWAVTSTIGPCYAWPWQDDDPYAQWQRKAHRHGLEVDLGYQRYLGETNATTEVSYWKGSVLHRRSPILVALEIFANRTCKNAVRCSSDWVQKISATRSSCHQSLYGIACRRVSDGMHIREWVCGCWKPCNFSPQ